MSLRLRVATLNIHKGLSLFNRRMVIHELREGLRKLEADIVFLQEVQGLHEKNALRFGAWPRAAQHEFLADEGWQHHTHGLGKGDSGPCLPIGGTDSVRESHRYPVRPLAAVHSPASPVRSIGS